MAVLLFLLLGAIYALTAKGTLGISDSLFSLRTAQAIWQRGALSLDTSEPDIKEAVTVHDGKAYSKYGIGLPLVWIPEVIAGERLAARFGFPPELVMRFLVSFYNVVFGAAACVLAFYLARFFKASITAAAAVALLLGLGTIAWRYSVWTFSEATQMFLVLGAVYGSVRDTPRSIVLGGASFGYLILIKVFSVIYLPVFVAYALARSHPLGRPAMVRLARFLGPVAAAAVVLLVLNYVRFGNVFEAGYGGEAQRFSLADLPSHALTLLGSADIGLFVYCPILVLAIVGYVPMMRTARAEALFLIGLILVNLFAAAAWYAYGCPWSWGPRFLVPTLPLYLLPLAGIPLDRKWKMLGVSAVAGLSIAVQVVGVLENNLEYVHIRDKVVSSEVRSGMPPILVGSAIILKHKILAGNNVYSLSEFGIDSGGTVDTSSEDTMVGLNLWYCHLARQLGKPALLKVPLVFLAAIGLLAVGLARALGFWHRRPGSRRLRIDSPGV